MFKYRCFLGEICIPQSQDRLTSNQAWLCTSDGHPIQHHTYSRTCSRSICRAIPPLYAILTTSTIMMLPFSYSPFMVSLLLRHLKPIHLHEANYFLPLSLHLQIWPHLKCCNYWQNVAGLIWWQRALQLQTLWKHGVALLLSSHLHRRIDHLEHHYCGKLL